MLGVHSNGIRPCFPWFNGIKGAGVKIAIIDEGMQMDHVDLAPNMFNLSYDAMNDTTPAKMYYNSVLPPRYGRHGTAVASIAAAVHNNNKFISGVAPEAQIMNISYNFEEPILQKKANAAARGIFWAVNHGADIINCSWGINYKSTYLDSAINYAIHHGRNGKGCVVIFGSGNENKKSIGYPANSNSEIMVVGGSDRYGKRYINPFAGANYGPGLDVVAPAKEIYYLVPTDSIEMDHGTSLAAPHVAGIAALILSKNPCLSGLQVRQILKKTARKLRPNVYDYRTNFLHQDWSWDEQMGHGLVDAKTAVEEATLMHTSSIDLFIRDTKNDIGRDSSYAWTWIIDKSPDIWVRNQPDGFINQVHDPRGIIYDSINTNPIYVYVRVGNKGCTTSKGTEQLSLYWSKASSMSSWPGHWNGSNYAIGGKIQTKIIPVLAPGRDTILQFIWGIPNPQYYQFSTACFLARIENSTEDPITVYSGHLEHDVYYNNNIAMRNSFVRIGSGKRYSRNDKLMPHGGELLVGNTTNKVNNFDFLFAIPQYEDGTPITEEAEVSLEFDQEGWDIFKNKFQNRSDIIMGDKKVILKNPSTSFNNISFQANQRIPIYVGFNFLTQKVTTKNTFEFRVGQKYHQSHPTLGDHWTGGVHYTLHKEQRNLFTANAGSDKTILKNTNVTLKANDIAEPAVYNWYDTEGNLIYTGKNFTVSPDVSKKYKLEIIANKDGFKDYDEIKVSVKQITLNSISPNPAQTQVKINYSLNNSSTTTYLSIGSINGGGNVNQYILNQNQSQQIINVSNYLPGIYFVRLIQNGEIKDTKTLIIQ